MTEWYLEAERGDADLVWIQELKEFRDYTVGRKRQFDIISRNPLVSRTHGLFKHKGNNRIYVHDTNSSNGIWVNDEKIKPGQDYLLKENDLIGIGSPSNASESDLELFRLRSRHLVYDSDNDIKKLIPKKEPLSKENKPFARTDARTSYENFVSSSSHVPKNEETDADSANVNFCKLDKTKTLTLEETIRASRSGNVTSIVASDLKTEEDSKNDVLRISYSPNHLENHGEHIFSFPDTESEEVIPKYQHKSRTSHTSDPVSKNNDNEEQAEHDNGINKDNTSKNSSQDGERIAVVRLSRLDILTLLKSSENEVNKVPDKPKKTREVLSPSSSEEEKEENDNISRKQHESNSLKSGKPSSSKQSLDASKSLNNLKQSSNKTSDKSKSPDERRKNSDNEDPKQSVNTKHGAIKKPEKTSLNQDDNKLKPKKTGKIMKEKVESTVKEVSKDRKGSLTEQLFGRSSSREKHKCSEQRISTDSNSRNKSSMDSSSSRDRPASVARSLSRDKSQSSERSSSREKQSEKSSSSRQRKKSSDSLSSRDKPASVARSLSRDKSQSSERSSSREKQIEKSSSSRENRKPSERLSSRDKPASVARSLSSQRSSSKENHIEKSSSRERKKSSDSSSSRDKRVSSTRHRSKSSSRQRKTSSDRPVSVARSLSRDKSLSSERSSSKEKHIEKSSSRERKKSSDSSSSRDKRVSSTRPRSKSSSRQRKTSSDSSSSGGKPTSSERPITRDKSLSSERSSSKEKQIEKSSQKSSFKDKQMEKPSSREKRISSDSSSSGDKPTSSGRPISKESLCSERSGSKEKHIEKSSENSSSKEKQIEKPSSREKRISSDSSSSGYKSSPITRANSKEKESKIRELNSKETSTNKPVSLEQSNSKEIQQKPENITENLISIDSSNSKITSQEKTINASTSKTTSQEKTVTESVKISVAKDLFPEVRTVKQERSDSVFHNQAEASTSKSHYEQILSIKQEILSEHQPSTSNYSSVVSVSSDSDTSPVRRLKQEVPSANNSFSTSCDIGEIICLSDDDDIFPKSQMFNDDDIDIKDEPLPPFADCDDTTIKKEVPVAEIDENIFGIIKKDVEFDDDAIIVDDDEDDEVDSMWYNRLSQPRYSNSQLEDDPLPVETFDEKKIISLRTGPTALNFLDDKDLIIDENDLIIDERGEETAVELQERVKYERDLMLAARAADDARMQDEIVPVCTAAQSLHPSISRATSVLEKLLDEAPVAVVPPPSPPATTATEPTPDEAKLDDKWLKDPTPDEAKSDDKWLKKPEPSTKKPYVIPPVIEAPHIVRGRRKTNEEIKPKEPQKRGRKRKQSVDERPAVAIPPPVKTFGTGTNLDKSVKNELDKRNKRRRHSTDALPMNKKQEIREERSKKLKELAQKTSEEKKQNEKPKNTSKPYIKLSSNRGLFLTNEEPAREAEKRKTRAKTPSELEPEPKKKFTIPKKKTEENAKVLEEVTLGVPATSKETSSEVRNTIIINNRNTTSEKENQNGFIKKRRVTFNDVPQIREYEIDEGNHMNKCTSKDAPLPRKVIQTLPPTRLADDSPENAALCDILSWVPIWLEEQKKTDAAPKLSMRNPIQMLHTFNTHGDYCNIVVPLLLLELWRAVYRDWISSRNPIMLALVDDVQNMNISKMSMLSLNCHCAITKVDSDRQLHPVRGDLIVIEVLLDEGSRRCALIKKLGYVVDISKRRLHSNDVINTKLLQADTVPECVVNFKIMLKDFHNEIKQGRLLRIRTISRIGPSLRIFKSVSMLNQSALCKFILQPNVKDYKIPKMAEMKLVIKDKLDADQLKCFIEACQICNRPEPGIYMIQGPPGTGKSRVIKNIVHQLLHGERKAGTKPSCILLCAPSNGAIDSLARKLLDMRQSLPQDKRFKMVRLGPPNSIHHKVKPISLPCLVEAYVKKQLKFKMEGNDAILDDLHFRQSKINMLENKLVSLRERKLDTWAVEIQLQKAKSDMELFHNRSKKELTYHERKRLERESEETIIYKADIVCTTLSSCIGSRMEELYQKKLLRFTCCIVDEATQSNEQETLIPLILGINKLILVGDPAQLPATVLSQEAKQLGYGNSLFYRIQKCLEHMPDNPIRMLKTQYRMHPEICKFPNEHFYYGKLMTSSTFIDNREALNIDNTGGAAFSYRYCVFALHTPPYQQQQQQVYVNIPEAQFVLTLTKLIMARTGYGVGIITPYTKQREYLQRGLDEITIETDKENDRVVVNTVDGFQGQERDVIIISCVRHSSNVFLADQQRLNVSLTRAKHALFICAHAGLFKNDDIWRKLEQDATKRHCFKYLNEKDYENEQYVTSLLYKS